MMKSIGLAVLLCVGMLTSAHAQTAAEQTCAIRASFLEGGPKGANEKIADLFSWNKKINLSSFNANFGVLYKVKVVDVGVFRFGQLGDFYQRHLVVATAVDNSPIYVLVDYERVAKTVRLFNVNFTTGAKKLLNEQKFFAAPEVFLC